MINNNFKKKRIEEELAARGIIRDGELNELMRSKPANENTMCFIAKKQAVPSDVVKQVAMDLSGYETVSLPEQNITRDMFDGIPADILRDNFMFPFGFDRGNKDVIKMAMMDPMNVQAIDTFQIRTGKQLVPYVADYTEIAKMISKYFGDAEAIEAANQFTQSYTGPAATETQNYVTNGDDSNPIVKIVNTIIEQAARMKASDIHFEPTATNFRIRYRIDGALQERPSYPLQMQSAVISRIKIVSGMDIAEKRAPQDGRTTIKVDGREFDIRVSTLPTVYGEKCVMRLALKEGLTRNKSELGLKPYEMKIFDRVIKKPNGILLVTGPTGSGKSTTLYTALCELNAEDVNIVTVEDPVEANIDGINQVQTNAKAGITFATALRSILRQDPDIIMIGEIRDQETAEIATQAAITGHIVVATLHTNSAASAIARLINMGIEPYDVADSLNGVIAQRLVRKLCPKCKKPRLATEAEKEELGIRKGVGDVTIYDKCGCAYCNNTGYDGRTGVYEIIDVTNSIRNLIYKGATTEDIKKQAVVEGMHTLHHSAAEYVAMGITTIDEIRKVSADF